MNDILTLAITAVLGGGFFKGLETLYRAVTDSKETKELVKIAGAKAPAEVDSVTVSTMKTALEAVRQQNVALQEDRERDRLYYQGRIEELTNQLERLRVEVTLMETQMRALSQEANKPR